jgi:hypothetical protein
VADKATALNPFHLPSHLFRSRERRWISISHYDYSLVVYSLKARRCAAMDSMSSNLKATLPLNVDEDPELLNLFKGKLYFSQDIGTSHC